MKFVQWVLFAGFVVALINTAVEFEPVLATRWTVPFRIRERIRTIAADQPNNPWSQDQMEKFLLETRIDDLGGKLTGYTMKVDHRDDGQTFRMEATGTLYIHHDIVVLWHWDVPVDSVVSGTALVSERARY